MNIKITAIGLVFAFFMAGFWTTQLNAGDSKDSGNHVKAMAYESFLELVKKRRSIRKFKPDPIPERDIERIVEAARWAPSGFNSQLWEFVVVRKPELKNRIAEIIASAFLDEMKKVLPSGSDQSFSPSLDQYAAFAKAPAFILLLGDTRVRNYGPPMMRTDDDRWQSVYLPSLSIAYQHMALAATSLGLGSQWVSAIHLPTVPEQIRKLIGIPEEMLFFDMFVVGYPDIEPSEKKMRPLEEMLHLDDCGVADFRTDEQVKAFFAK